MRVTNRMMIDSAIQHMEANLERLNSAREKASTGKQFQRISDDPLNATAAIDLRSSLQSTQAYLETAHRTDEWMVATEAAMKQIMELATKVYNLALRGVSDTLDDTSRRALAEQVNTLLEQALETGNSKHQGNYLFSGVLTQTAPFSLASTPPGTAEYNGDDGIMPRNLAPNLVINANTRGTVFLDLFNSLVAVREALNPDNSQDLGAATSSLHTSMDRLSQARSNNAARLNQVQSAAQHLEDMQLSLKGLLSQREDASLIEAISQLHHQETVYQAVLAVSNRTIAATNLFDYLS